MRPQSMLLTLLTLGVLELPGDLATLRIEGLEELIGGGEQQRSAVDLDDRRRLVADAVVAGGPDRLAARAVERGDRVAFATGE